MNQQSQIDIESIKKSKLMKEIAIKFGMKVVEIKLVDITVDDVGRFPTQLFQDK